MNRKDFIKSAFGTALALTGADALARPVHAALPRPRTAALARPVPPEVRAPSAFTLPPLPYGFDALEPHIDKLTMEIHHGRHHKAYVDNLNKAVEGTPMAKLTIEQILKS